MAEGQSRFVGQTTTVAMSNDNNNTVHHDLQQQQQRGDNDDRRGDRSGANEQTTGAQVLPAAAAGAATILAVSNGGAEWPESRCSVPEFWCYKQQTPASAPATADANSANATANGVNVPVGDEKRLACRKTHENNDFRLQLYVLVAIGALFVIWAVLYFPLSIRNS